jgi:hypothetical protein
MSLLNIDFSAGWSRFPQMMPPKTCSALGRFEMPDLISRSGLASIKNPPVTPFRCLHQPLAV